MSLLGFKAVFAGPVERREKRRTIRKSVNGHAVGRAIQLYTGLRTKTCRKLSAVDPVCTSIEPVEVIENASCVIIGKAVVRGDDLVAFAQADGFTDLVSFFEFFHQPDGSPFKGFLIQWDWQ